MTDIATIAAGVKIVKEGLEAIDKGVGIFNRIAKKFQKVEIAIINFLGQAIEVSLSLCEDKGWVTIQDRITEEFKFHKRLMGTTICKCKVIRQNREGQRFPVYGGGVPKKLCYTYGIYEDGLFENGSKVRDWGRWELLHSDNLEVDKTTKNFVQQLINAADNLDEETLVELRTHQFSAQILDTILEKVGVNFKNSGGVTLLHIAADSGYLDAVKVLIDKHPLLINATDNHNQRPIHLAAERGHYGILVCLLKNNLEVNELANYKNDDGEIVSSVSALHLAACHGHAECVEILLKRGANKEQEDSDKWTPLHYACRNGHPKVAELLLKKNANIRAKTEDNSTPLHLASFYGHLEVAKLLKKKGAEE